MCAQVLSAMHCQRAQLAAGDFGGGKADNPCLPRS